MSLERDAREAAIHLSDIVLCTHEGCPTKSILSANIRRLGAELFLEFVQSQETVRKKALEEIQMNHDDAGNWLIAEKALQ